MKKTTKSTVSQAAGSSYSLRRNSAVNTTKQNDLKTKLTVKKSKLAINKAGSNVTEATYKPIARTSNRIIKNNLIKESPGKKLTVLSTKIRPQRIKQLTDVSTPKTKQLDQKTPNTASRKTNESIESMSAVKDITVLLGEPVISRCGEIIKKRGRPKKLTVLASKIRPEKIKQLTDVSTPKTKQLDQKTPNTASKKTNESIESKSAVKDITVPLGQPVISGSGEIIKNRGRPKQLTVLASKIRPEKIKQLTDVSTPKTKQLDQKTPNTANKKTNESIESKSAVKNITVPLGEPVISRSGEIIKKRGRPKKVTVLASKIRPEINKQLTNASTPKTKQLDQIRSIISGKEISELTVETKETNIINKTPQILVTPTVRLERLSKRLERLYTNKHKNKIQDDKLNDINSTPQNKDVSIRNISERPTRVLRKRNHIISNKYKDFSLNSPLFIKNSQKPATPNPLAVYEFEFDPLDEPAKKQGRKNKYVSESSGEDDNEMKKVIKKLRKKSKKVPVKKNKKVKKKQIAEAQNKIELVDKQPKNVPNSETKQDHIVVKQMKQTEVADKQLPVPEKQMKPTTVVEKQLPVPEKQMKPTTVVEKQLPVPEKQMKPTTVVEKQLPVVEKQLPSPEKQNKSTSPEKIQNNLSEPEIINELPQITINSGDMDNTSDYSDLFDPIPPVDPSIQARNIVEEVTKSFIEDLSDEELIVSPGKIKIHSNVMVQKSKTYKKKNKIFNSTVNGSKPSRPWRIDVSAIRRTPYIFTYKDKSFTPRYEPEIVTVNFNSILKEKDSDKNEENTKPTFQTSILDFVNGSKPKIIENKINGLFNDLPKKPVQSPRKVLGEINFIQSTPLKPITNNILNSPNISFIKPKNKSSDSMFGFSYFSDEDENKENVRKSPRKSPKKLKPKTANPVVEIVKETVPILGSSQQNTNDKDDAIVKEENPTLTESENFTEPIDSDLSLALFQDVENEEVLKKSTRKYVRKNPKRKRLSSVDTVPSEDESEPEHPEKKKRKQKNVRTKEEEQEANRLAAHYNSIFEEMENYPLIIE